MERISVNLDQIYVIRFIKATFVILFLSLSACAYSPYNHKLNYSGKRLVVRNVVLEGSTAIFDQENTILADDPDPILLRLIDKGVIEIDPKSSQTLKFIFTGCKTVNPTGWAATGQKVLTAISLGIYPYSEQDVCRAQAELSDKETISAEAALTYQFNFGIYLYLSQYTPPPKDTSIKYRLARDLIEELAQKL